MAFIGTPLDTRNTFQSLAGKRFNGDGSTTAFTLDVAPSSTLDIEVFVGNVRQDPNSAYTLSGTTLTFTGAPPSGTNNIYVVHQAKSVGTINPGANSVGVTELNVSDGSNGQALTTNGSGTLSFSSVGADADDYFATSGLSSKDLGVGLHIKTADSGASVASGADELIVEGSADTGLSILSGTDANGSIMFGDSADNDGGRIQYNPNNDRMMFSTNGSERMRLKSNGLQLGDLNEALGATSSAHGLSCSGNGYASLRVRRGADTGDAVAFFGKSSNSTPVGGVSVSGTATSFNTSSDYRLKENEVAILDGITRLKTLKPYRFNFKADADTTVDGFFAHEVSSVVPEAISGEKDGEEMQAIDQSKLVPLLTSALQEAITKIETLEARVTTLEG
jgi:hypothetical protein